MTKITKEEALLYHSQGKPGKIEVVPTKPYSSQRDLSLAYSPGVAEPCLEIKENEEAVYDYTNKGNLVAVISNGTAVLGLGDIGPVSYTHLAMIPLIRNEVVKKKKWLEDDEFIDMLAIAQSIPGPMALNTALFVGHRRLGFKGSLFSGLGVILPSFIIILFIAIIFTQFKDNPVIERIFKGIRPAVVALIAGPLVKLGKAAGITRKNAWIPIAVIIAVWLLKISPVYVVIAAILIGITHLAYLKQKLKK